MLAANAQYQRLRRIPLEDGLGRTARERDPTLDQVWLDAFQRIVREQKAQWLALEH